MALDHKTDEMLGERDPRHQMLTNLLHMLSHLFPEADGMSIVASWPVAGKPDERTVRVAHTLLDSLKTEEEVRRAAHAMAEKYIDTIGQAVEMHMETFGIKPVTEPS